MAVLNNFFASPRTTLAGAGALIVGAIGSQALPAIVALLGSQPSIGWQVAGYLVGMVVPGLMADAKKKLEAVAQTPAKP